MYCRRVSRLLVSNAGILVGSLSGFVGGVYGAIVGALLGSMLDGARAERRLRAWLADPSRPAPDEVLPGLSAALALSRDSGGAGNDLMPGTRRQVLEGLLYRRIAASGWTARLFHRPHPRALLDQVVDIPESGLDIDRAALARWLATEGSEEARELLGEAVWKLEAAGGGSLGWERERKLAAGLADAGLGIEAIRRTRETGFPDWRSPWEILGLEGGASRESVRKAWKQVSKRLHPDSGGPGAGEAEFIEARSAYELLAGPEASLEASLEAAESGPGGAGD